MIIIIIIIFHLLLNGTFVSQPTVSVYRREQIDEQCDESLLGVFFRWTHDNASKFAVLQALQYLHKLCSHPALVITAHHPQFSSITTSLQHAGSSLRDIQHAPKLVALQYVLLSLIVCDVLTSVIELMHIITLTHRFKLSLLFTSYLQNYLHFNTR